MEMLSFFWHDHHSLPSFLVSEGARVIMREGEDDYIKEISGGKIQSAAQVKDDLIGVTDFAIENSSSKQREPSQNKKRKYKKQILPSARQSRLLKLFMQSCLNTTQTVITTINSISIQLAAAAVNSSIDNIASVIQQAAEGDRKNNDQELTLLSTVIGNLPTDPFNYADLEQLAVSQREAVRLVGNKPTLKQLRGKLISGLLVIAAQNPDDSTTVKKSYKKAHIRNMVKCARQILHIPDEQQKQPGILDDDDDDDEFSPTKKKKVNPKKSPKKKKKKDLRVSTPTTTSNNSSTLNRSSSPNLLRNNRTTPLSANRSNRAVSFSPPPCHIKDFVSNISVDSISADNILPPPPPRQSAGAMETSLLPEQDLHEFFTRSLDNPHFSSVFSVDGIEQVRVGIAFPEQPDVLLQVKENLRLIGQSYSKGLLSLSDAEKNVKMLISRSFHFVIDIRYSDTLEGKTPGDGMCCFYAHHQLRDYVKQVKERDALLRESNDDGDYKMEEVPWVEYPSDFAYTPTFQQSLKEEIQRLQVVSKHQHRNKFKHEEVLKALQAVQSHTRKNKNKNPKPMFGRVAEEEDEEDQPRWGDVRHFGLIFPSSGDDIPGIYFVRHNLNPLRFPQGDVKWARLQDFAQRASIDKLDERVPEVLNGYRFTLRQLKAMFDNNVSLRFGITYDGTSHFHGLQFPPGFTFGQILELIDQATRSVIDTILVTDFPSQPSLKLQQEIFSLVSTPAGKPPPAAKPQQETASRLFPSPTSLPSLDPAASCATKASSAMVGIPPDLRTNLKTFVSMMDDVVARKKRKIDYTDLEELHKVLKKACADEAT